MKSTALDTVFYWGAYQSDRRIDFNGYLWCADGGNVLIDPMQIPADRMEFLGERGGAAWILLSNHDHLRAAPELKEKLAAQVLAPSAERARFGADADVVDVWYGSTDELPAALRPQVEVFAIRGGKSEVEMAFYLTAERALFFGDVVRSHESGRLRLLPDPKITERAAIVESLRPIAEREVDAVLLGDGDPLFAGADGVWRDFVGGLHG